VVFGTTLQWLALAEPAATTDATQYRALLELVGPLGMGLLRELGALRGKRILDIGTGNSPFPQWIKVKNRRRRREAEEEWHQGQAHVHTHSAMEF